MGLMVLGEGVSARDSWECVFPGPSLMSGAGRDMGTQLQ